MEELISTLVGESVSRAFDWVSAGITEKRQQREVEELLEETRLRAAMIPTTVNLAEKFGNSILVGELISNLTLKIKPRDESIATFLDGGDAAAIEFTERFCDEIDRIMSSPTNSIADVKTLRLVEEGNKNIQMIVDWLSVNQKDMNAQLSLLEGMVGFVAAGKTDVEYLDRLSYDAGESLTSRYLAVYVSLCRGQAPNPVDLSDVSGKDALILALASVAISSENASYAGDVLRLCSFDAGPIISIVQELTDLLGQTSGRKIEFLGVIPKGVEELLNLINFEVLFRGGAFQAAVMYANDAKIAWNPIAIEERSISELISAAVVNDDDLFLKVQQEVSRFRSWFPKDLIKRLERAISASFLQLAAGQVRELISELPDCLSVFAEDEKRQLELRDCSSSQMARDILVWAEARHNPFLMIDAALKLVELDAGARSELIDTFDRCGAWAFPNVGVLRMYVYGLNPDISYEKYCELGKGMEKDALFHLIAYERFYDTLPVAAAKHIETAVSIMKDPAGAKDLLSAYIWVPYLYGGGRDEEIRQIVEGVLPIAPYEHIASFFSALAKCSGSEEMIADLVESMAGSKFWDPRVAELVAGHLVAHGRMDVAGPVANAFFRAKHSELLAEIVVQWACESCIDPDADVIDFLRQVDTSQSNMLLAGYYREKGEKLTSDALLVRASFGEGESSGRALAYYAIEHATEVDGKEGVERIDKDCYVVLSSSDGGKRVFLFFADPTAVAAEGVSNSIGSAFSLQSKEFLYLRGLHQGEACQIDGEKFTVVEMGKVDSLLCRAGFAELANNSECTVAISSIDELLEHLKRTSEETTSKMKMYQNGIVMESGTAYLGIETGAALVGASRRLEFVGEAICNPNYPYRKNPVSRNVPIDEKNEFLVSYNAAVVLSFLDLPAEVLSQVRQKCFITKSTAKRLRKDAQTILEDSYRSAGRLVFDGERPVLFENDEETRRCLKKKWLPVLDFISGLDEVEPIASSSGARKLPRLLFENESIDIQTAGDRNLIYVTEDLVESQICDASAVSRCGVSVMLIRAGHLEYVFTDYAKQMVEWGAQPSIEDDLVALYKEALLNALNSLGLIEGNSASSVRGETDESDSAGC
ncbi:hypothetical protein [Candidatus Collinsella stercoripullorum]|uniref:hypothetical protein n=1 Tax=Candidatus Collinsella stercoripullorum TaxID=2838522 RepID=UPI0022DFB2E5|nr:hypothetical protein [Candidatus Collinsella stercoripullorum]